MNILLVADQTLFRDGIKLLLKKSYPLSRCDEADCLDRALEALISQSFDLVLLDIKLRDAIGLDSLRGIKKHVSHTPIIVIADDIDLHLANLAISYGASAYISKTASYVQLEHAITTVQAGHIFLSPELRQTSLNSHYTQKPASGISVLSSLSERQKEVLRHIARGSSNKNISEAMNISQNTVKAHLASIFKILGVHNRTEAFYFATRAGMPID